MSNTSPTDKPNLTPPPVVDDRPAVPALDINSMLSQFKARAKALTVGIERKTADRKTLQAEIVADRDELKRVERFIAAEKPRGSK